MLNGNKIVAVIPLRLGSQRCKNKNIRLLNNKILPAYVIESAKQSGIFDEIYINSSSDVFRSIAEELGVKFYKREESLSDPTITHEHFINDFCSSVESDYIFMLHSTSPFTKPETIKGFVTEMCQSNFDTLVSIKTEQEMILKDNSPVNFDFDHLFTQSQKLKPVQEVCWGITGWRTSALTNISEDLKPRTFIGNVGFYEVDGIETLDIHHEEDFIIADLVARNLEGIRNYKPQFYGEYHSEADVPNILVKDGVSVNDLHDANHLKVNISDIRSKFGVSNSWSKRVVNTENNSATVIQQMPGEGNRRHFHPDWNEWWYILDGEWEWEVENATHNIKKGDIVFIPKGKVHKITAIGDKPAVRLAVSREDVPHVYPDGDHRN
jgi:CMP-N-acetylneuraminic acid synthetase/quercetin dioxygenase-like cupin family protein